MTLAIDSFTDLAQRRAEAARLSVMGQNITVRVSAKQSGGRCSVFDIDAAPGLGVPTHVHDREDEIFIVRAGVIRVVLDGQEMLCYRGDSVVLPKGVPHAWWVEGDSLVSVTVIATPANMEAMFAELESARPNEIGAICERHAIRFV